MNIELLPFQRQPAEHLRRIYESERLSINGSDTGTGKTYMGLHLIEHAQRPTLIVCPKAVIPNWRRLTEGNDQILDVINLEKLKTGKQPWLTRDTGAGDKTFTWHLPEKPLVLIDEAHHCSGVSSLNAYMLAYLRATDAHVHLMSATLADSPAKFRAFGYLMGLHDFVRYHQWAMERGCFLDERGELRFTSKNVQAMRELHGMIFPRFGVRMRIDEIDDFPDNTINLTLTSFTGTAAYKKRVDEIMEELEDTELFGDWAGKPANDHKEENSMVKLLRERQRAELLKIPALVTMVRDCVAEEQSAAVFLNFKRSIEIFNEMLGIPSVTVTGDKSRAEREDAQEKFQNNQVHVFVCTHGAGGTGIDLHDLHGRRRQAFISPCFHTIQFRQTLGRIHRAGSLSPAVQFIVCQADTSEQMVLNTLNRKLRQLDTLNDGDLQT